MKRLFLLRHAKAEMDSPDGSDFGRPLSERGKRDAARMGEKMRQLGLRFDRVLASPAHRVVETVEAVGELAPTFDRRIYNAAMAQLLEVVRAVDDNVESLLIVGHNPGIGQLAAQLTASGIDDFPPCALAAIELSVERRQDIKAGGGQLVRFITPADLD